MSGDLYDLPARINPERERAEKAEAEIDEYDQLLSKLSALLHGTANALKGEPPPLTLWDWSDLPVVAEKVVAERDRYRSGLEEIVGFDGQPAHDRAECADEMIDVANDALAGPEDGA